MVKIRLTRTGRKNYATFRLVVVEARSKRDTKAIEEVGFYLPHEKKTELKTERIKYWLSVGAQPSDTVTRMLVRAEILGKEKLPKKKFNSKPGKKATERNAKRAEKAEAAKAAKSKPAAEVPSAESTDATTTESAE